MRSEPTLTLEPTLTSLEGAGPFIVCTACGPKARMHVSCDGVYQVTCLNCKSGAHVRRVNRPHYWDESAAPAPSIDDRGDWECAECGPGKPKQLVGAHLHCMLCGDECRVRPAVLAAMKQRARPDVIEPSLVVTNARFETNPPGVDLSPPPVRGRPPARNSCHNRPDQPPPYLAQDGYEREEPTHQGFFTRRARYVEVHHVMSTDCRYDRRGTDAKCDGCRHR